MKNRLLPGAVALLLTNQAAQSAPLPSQQLPSLPFTQHSGSWASGHVQGIAVDLEGGYIYYSFTNLLAKYDFSGRLIGTLVGWSGHLGDLDFNPADGELYGSLEYKAHRAFYIAVIDVGRLDRVGLEESQSDLFRTVYLREVVKDYSADLDGDGKVDEDDGKFRGDPTRSLDHRYGCSGIDGVAFGPAFGKTDGKRYLTVAYGVYGNAERSDNDHQVLLQYDITDWARLARPLNETDPHHDGPRRVQGKYFVRTGNTRYGVQNLSYDGDLRRWFMGVYQGNKPAFPNYLLFAVDARDQPQRGDLVGVRAAGRKGWETGMLLRLADDGLSDRATGIRGWNQKADVGFQPVGHRLFYLSVNSATKGRQSADLTLMRWTGDAQQPFVPATRDALQQQAGATDARQK